MLPSSRGELAGWLYLPEPANGEPAPGLVMAHGLSAVKEMCLDDYASVFAGEGIVALVFDTPGFGASGGTPRQAPYPQAQIDAYREMIGWLRQRPEVDGERIGAWGTSFSGGNVITLAAGGNGLRAAVAQVPGLGEGGPPASEAFLEAMAAALEQDSMVLATSPPDGPGVMRADGAHEWFHRVAAERAPSWRNELKASALAELGPYRPIDELAKVAIPLLLLVAPDDLLTPPGPALALTPSMSNVEVVEVSGGHFDVYEGEGFEESSRAESAFFKRHL